MPNLFVDILSENSHNDDKVCGMVKLLDRMNEQDRSDVEKALADETITGEAIGRALRRNGFKVNSSMIRRHRRRDCACGNSG